MNKDTIIGLVLIFAIMIGFFYLNKPSEEEIKEMEERAKREQMVAEQQQSRDSLTMVDTVAKTPATISENTSGEITNVVDDTVKKISQQTFSGPFASSYTGDTAHYIIENDLVAIAISNKGGRITSVELKEYKTYDSLPLILFMEESSEFYMQFFAGRKNVNSSDLFFQPFYYDASVKGDKLLSLNNNDVLVFGMRLYPDSNGAVVDKTRYIEYRYTLKKDEYMVDFDIRFKGMEDIVESTLAIPVHWSMDLRKQEKTVNRFSGPTIYYMNDEGSVDNLSENKDSEEKIPTSIKWVGFKQQFFTSVLIAENAFTYSDLKVFTDESKENVNDRYLRSMEGEIGLHYENQDDYTIPLHFYFGPTKYKILRKYDLNLERQIPLGWGFLLHWINRFAVIPIFNWLEATGMNYGIIILILTILLKIVLFPIARKTYVSSAKMRLLKPEIDEIAKKYPKREDAMKKQQATMALYKAAGANPMSGCVPMLLQLPILLALFRFFPASIELRQQSFLWADDLSSYDSILELGFNIPFYGDHVSLFTLLMTVSTIFYTHLNNQMMASTSQMPGMKLMMYIMPVMFLGIFNNYASGLSYYYFLANMITFAQMFVFRKFIDEDKLRKKIEMSKKKPKKKSGFQKRLEDMQRKQQQAQKKR